MKTALTLVALLVAWSAAALPDDLVAPAATEAAAVVAVPSTQVLVFKDGRRLEVRSYKVDGRALRIVGLDGAPLIMRAEQVDVEASRLASEKRQAELAKQAQQEEAAAKEAEEARLAKEAERARPRKPGTMTIVEGSASRDVTPADDGESGGSGEAETSTPAKGDQTAKERPIHVRNYVKKDGTKVKAHGRAAPKRK